MVGKKTVCLGCEGKKSVIELFNVENRWGRGKKRGGSKGVLWENRVL